MKIKKIGKKTLGFLGLLLVGVGMFYLLAFVMTPYSRLSIYPAAILKIYVGLLALIYMDKIHHAGYDTSRAITEKNTAYGLIILAYSIIIGAVMLSV